MWSWLSFICLLVLFMYSDHHITSNINSYVSTDKSYVMTNHICGILRNKTEVDRLQDRKIVTKQQQKEGHKSSKWEVLTLNCISFLPRISWQCLFTLPSKCIMYSYGCCLQRMPRAKEVCRFRAIQAEEIVKEKSLYSALKGVCR